MIAGSLDIEDLEIDFLKSTQACVPLGKAVCRLFGDRSLSEKSSPIKYAEKGQHQF